MRQVRQCSINMILLSKSLTSSCFRISCLHSLAYSISGHSQRQPIFQQKIQIQYLMKLMRFMERWGSASACWPSAALLLEVSSGRSGSVLLLLKIQKAMENQQDRLVQILITKSTAETAPIMPPMNENTADSFCTSLVQTMELEDLAMLKAAQVPLMLVWKGWLTARSSARQPVLVSILEKGQMLWSVWTVQSLKQRQDWEPMLSPNMEQVLSSMYMWRQSLLSGLIWVLEKQTVKQKKSWFCAKQFWISSALAQGRAGSVLFWQAETCRQFSLQVSEEYLPIMLRVVFMLGQSQQPDCSRSKLLAISGQSLKYSLVQVSKGMLVEFVITPQFSVYSVKVTSKQRLVSDRFCLQTSTAIRKRLSGVISSAEAGGTAFLMTSVAMVKVLSSRVFKIMVAKPAKMVSMIATEMMPPVRVLYQRSSSQRSISVEQKKSTAVTKCLSLPNNLILQTYSYSIFIFEMSIMPTLISIFEKCQHTIPLFYCTAFVYQMWLYFTSSITTF